MNEDKKAYRKLKFAKPPHVMVVDSRFYNDIADNLLAGVKDVLDANGATFELFTVPGALEVPAAIEMGVKSARFDAYVALGCVIRGATTHYEIVSGESGRALVDISVRHALCLGNGILTVENRQQAMERANPAQMDKGGGAAQAALEMLEFRHKLFGHS